MATRLNPLFAPLLLQSAAAFAALASAGCVDGPCREIRHPALAAQSQGTKKAKAIDAHPETQPGKPDLAAQAAGAAGKTLVVYKADGSLQCGQGTALSAVEMERQLSGIHVFSRDKKPDGMMHIQVCGSPTGMINIFEIPTANLKDAESKGFKKLDTR